MIWWTLGKTGYSDSESIGGSLESLSSPGKHKPAFVPFWFTFIWKSCKDKHVWFPLYCVFALLECIIEAHTNRRLPKTTSTLTISSDDPDDRDVASESGLLLPFYASINRILLKSTWPNPPMGMILSSEYTDGQPVKVISRAALTHRLRKMKSKMVKCKQCDNYIVVSGVECEEVWGQTEDVYSNRAT